MSTNALIGTDLALLRFAMEAGSEQEMQPIMTPCDACGRDAVIHKIRYKYSVEKPSGPAAENHTLRETQRDIECPQCGMRTQIEVHQSQG
jgi:ssDNA-binding Zn-finger/Zn-ribbon topoisomerase 1